MKAKQIVDLGTSISNDSNVQANTNARHTHDETNNVVPVSDGAGNYDDSQIGDDGTTVTVGSDAQSDANHLMWIAKDIQNTMKLDQIKDDGDSFLLTLDADQDNTGKNYGLKITANGSTDENIAMAISSGKAIIGALSGDDSALMEISSTSNGILIPRMTTTQMNAITTPANGLMVYDTTANDLMVNIGDGATPNWIGLKAVGITGSGTVGTIPRFATATSIENSQITDDGSTIAIGTTHSSSTFVNILNTLATGLIVASNKVSGTVASFYSYVNGNATRNIGSWDNAENGDQNTGVVGSSGTKSETQIFFHNDEKFVGVRGYSKGVQGDNGIGVLGVAMGKSDVNIGVVGKADESSTFARGIVGLGGGAFKEDNGSLTTNEPSAVLYAESTTRGFLAPKMTATQRDAISQPANGLIVFVTDTSDLQVNTGDTVTPVWTSLGTTGITGSLTLDSVPRATGAGTIDDGSINDNGIGNVSIGQSPDTNTAFKIVSSESFGVDANVSGSESRAGKFYTTTNGSGTNIALWAKTADASDVVFRYDNGVDNSGKYLRIENADGDVELVTLTAITSGGTNTNNYLSKFNASGQLVDSQIFDDGSNVYALDNAFSIRDNGDTTKKLSFEASAITTGTERNIIMVDRDVTMIGSGGTNTQNKVAKYDANGDLIDTLITDDGSQITVSGAIETTGNFIAPTNTISLSGNNAIYSCLAGMAQILDLQGQTGNGSLTILSPVDGNTYTLIVIQGSGTHDLDFPAGYWINDSAFDFTTLADNERALVTITHYGSDNYYSAKKLTYAS